VSNPVRNAEHKQWTNTGTSCDEAVRELEQVGPDTVWTQTVRGYAGQSDRWSTGLTGRKTGRNTGHVGLVHIFTDHNKSTTTLIQR